MAKRTITKKGTGFGGTFTDMGSKHAEGMEEKPADKKFGGTFSDMGSKDAVGVGNGK